MFGALLELTIGVALAPVVIVADVLETPGKLIEGDTLFPVHTLEHIVDIVDRMEDSVL